MPIVKLSSKSQLVLPAAIRKRLAIKPGDLLQVIEKDDAIVIRRAPSSYVDALERCASDLWRGYETELERSRERWDS
ncbi:AbrB/MazE/SpoVT family DNA-binding domain-containing protein [Desulfoferrobacter suflitae]|uniref:AbrB/MazE/SpoVT family DNA-binding domain-containing protein n=1 Tax=Desulfoferrobacter suflitae TaxID=2865782 RepID=UPI0021640B25|nr:AbrB/MazE/SpoVT family DNA-binding domain-containing protein [Desulfoferrobacter suflitae]MCK8603288.1 AbrB/MazE/SpoVT family DNA-binding domain-containing protein [Desulfoferrobacter suflitae]